MSEPAISRGAHSRVGRREEQFWELLLQQRDESVVTAAKRDVILYDRKPTQ